MSSEMLETSGLKTFCCNYSRKFNLQMFPPKYANHGTLLLKYMFLFSVYPDGRVCISILHAPGDDPMGYESSAERWSPVQSVEKILLSVVSMLAGMKQIYLQIFS